MIWLYSFLFAGIMCAIGETIYQFTKLSPGHITSIYVIAGVFLDSFNIYDFFIKNCGGGAYILITSFGHSLAHEAKLGALLKGLNASAKTAVITNTGVGSLISAVNEGSIEGLKAADEFYNEHAPKIQQH